MKANIYGIVKGNTVLIENSSIDQYDGMRVAISILDEPSPERTEGGSFLDALRDDRLVIPTELGNRADSYIKELRK